MFVTCFGWKGIRTETWWSEKTVRALRLLHCFEDSDENRDENVSPVEQQGQRLDSLDPILRLLNLQLGTTQAFL
jgi:hypothetical protein